MPLAYSTAEESVTVKNKLEMWANAQRDGRPAEYRWRPLFNRHLGTIAQLCPAISLHLRHVSTKQQYVLHMSPYMVHFGPLAAEIDPVV